MVLVENFIQYIQIILTPIAMISGVGIISLLTQTRYGRVVDSSRHLDREKLSLFRYKIAKRPSELERKLIEKRIDSINLQRTGLPMFLFHSPSPKRRNMSLP